MTDPDSWPHFLADEKSPWQTITVCSEGNPVILYREIGKGCAVVSAIRQPSMKAVANYYAYSQLHKSGLTAKSFTMSPLRPGDGSLSIELAHEAPKGTSISFTIVNEKKKTATFSTNIVGTAVSLDFNVPFRGPIQASLLVNTPTGKNVIFSRQAEMPRLMEIGPNAYRGLLSTKRRLDDVKFPVSLEPDFEDLTLAKIALSVYDSSSNEVVSLETILPSNDVPRKIWIPVPLDKKLSAGGYRIDALLTKRGTRTAKAIRATSSATFEIIKPRVAQTVVDEDGTFLVNGIPFFPLGIYHTNPDRYAEIAELGFNAQQFWKWHVGSDGYGAPLGLDKAAANKLKCLFESNHQGRHIYKQCANQFADHSAIFMWYVADEPAEGSEAFMTMANDTWHEFDKHHPTYVASCRPDLFTHHAKYADVFGFDPYPSYQTLIDWCRLAEKEIAPHQATICVPWADQSDIRMIRAQAYTAICHNIRGLIWYCWNQAGGGPLGVGIHNKPEAQAEYKKLLAELNEMIPALTSTTRRTFEEGAIHAIVVGGKKDWRKRYLIMVNTSDKEVKADFEVPELKGVKNTTAPFLPDVEKKDAKGNVVKDRKGKPVMVERPFELTEGRVVHTFKPYDTFVIHW